jgi:hypothetical protein
MNEQSRTEQGITGYASLLNAAHLLAEETAYRLYELATRYPDALPPDVVTQALPEQAPEEQQA